MPHKVNQNETNLPVSARQQTYSITGKKSRANQRADKDTLASADGTPTLGLEGKNTDNRFQDNGFFGGPAEGPSLDKKLADFGFGLLYYIALVEALIAKGDKKSLELMKQIGTKILQDIATSYTNEAEKARAMEMVNANAALASAIGAATGTVMSGLSAGMTARAFGKSQNGSGEGNPGEKFINSKLEKLRGPEDAITGTANKPTSEFEAGPKQTAANATSKASLEKLKMDNVTKYESEMKTANTDAARKTAKQNYDARADRIDAAKSAKQMQIDKWEEKLKARQSKYGKSQQQWYMIGSMGQSVSGVAKSSADAAAATVNANNKYQQLIAQRARAIAQDIGQTVSGSRSQVQQTFTSLLDLLTSASNQALAAQRN